MFDFLKRSHKKALPTFAPLGVDIHCHLVPRVDDGSKSVDETSLCLNTMRDAGFEKVFITPHYQFTRFPNEEEDIRQRFANLRQELDKMGGIPGLELSGVAGEYRVDSVFQDRIKNRKFLLIANRYLLIEFSLHQQVMGLDQILFDLQMAGYEVILAHPERYPYFSAKSQRLEHFKDMGINFQVNALSLSGFYGEACRSKAFDMIEHGWVEFIGTDTHNPLYAQALIDATHDRKIQKLMATHTFQNKDIFKPATGRKL